jgi:predicted SnoaL-like aldol condensation-catalyzing enzyme
MSVKQIIQDFYKSDALIDPEVMAEYLHPDVTLEWNSSTGLMRLNYSSILAYTAQLSKAYVRTKVKIGHILEDGDVVSLRFEHSVKTIENPREEMPLANFFAIWELRDGKLYKGYQMSQPVSVNS